MLQGFAWKKIALLCVTAVCNGNVELKVGVLPVRLAVTLHVLFPPLACFPFFVSALHVLSRMASKKGLSIQNTACWCCFIKASRRTISRLPPPSRRASQNRQVDNGSRMCFSSLKIEHYFFFLPYKKRQIR